MQSFRTELENPIVERDILELERKIHEFEMEKFRRKISQPPFSPRCVWPASARSSNGSIKLPYGKMTLAQWKRIADVSDEFATGIFTYHRQDVQIHFVAWIVHLNCGFA
jgi:sulfite reductase (ferredoxin)